MSCLAHLPGYTNKHNLAVFASVSFSNRANPGIQLLTIINLHTIVEKTYKSPTFQWINLGNL